MRAHRELRSHLTNSPGRVVRQATQMMNILQSFVLGRRIIIPKLKVSARSGIVFLRSLCALSAGCGNRRNQFLHLESRICFSLQLQFPVFSPFFINNSELVFFDFVGFPILRSHLMHIFICFYRISLMAFVTVARCRN